jgi:uncharacterized SAM-dependent methyltransferase
MGLFKKKAPQQTKVNDLIFKELIKRGYSLEGNTRVWNIADSKLWYLTPNQAQGYLDLEDTENFRKIASNAEFELLENFLSEMKHKIGHGAINLVDLGCGDGKKAAYIFEKFKKMDSNLKIRYCPIDISGYMVEKAIETFSDLDVEEVIEFKYNISDFENLENITPLLRKGDFKKNLFLLLGYTLGNFEINELLYEIRGAMNSDDVLVIVSGIAHERWDEWVEFAKQNKKMDFFFSHIPLQLGLSREDIEWGARIRNTRVEYYYTIRNDRVIEFQDKKVQFDKGDQIVVAVAYKHDKDDLMTYLNMHFNDVTVKTSKDKSTILAICKR